MSDPVDTAFARRTDSARQRMVDRIEASARHSPAVVAAMRQVPRHLFLPRFWTSAHTGAGGAPREWRLDAARPDDAAVELAYSPDRALAIVPDVGPSGATSTASAPNLMATMLDALELRPGLRVLEVGVGSGYNAALLAELVGDASLVTTIDIDVGVAERARRHLELAGYGTVRVVAGDGFYGASEGAPYDRVIVTVGCSDLAPSWLQQLLATGAALVPLEHAGSHPIVRATPVDPDRQAATGRVIARSAFVRVQGKLAQPGPWPSAALALPLPGPQAERLPAELARALAERAPRHPAGAAEADLAYFVGLADHRAANPGGCPGLAVIDDRAQRGATAIDVLRRQIVWQGPGGRGLRADLLAHANTWLDLGGPEMGDFRSTWVPIESPPPGGGERVWAIERVAFRQQVRLP